MEGCLQDPYKSSFWVLKFKRVIIYFKVRECFKVDRLFIWDRKYKIAFNCDNVFINLYQIY